MQIIISPAKKMRNDRDFLAPVTKPQFIAQAQELVDLLKALPLAELRGVLQCNASIASLNFDRYAAMDLSSGARNPAILCYDGIQYTYMASQVFNLGQYGYLQEHLRIISGLYGVLRPLDGVVPYRLEMQAKLMVNGCPSLYAYWGNLLGQAIGRESNDVLDLCSKEYSQAVVPHLPPGTRCVSCRFCEQVGSKLVEKGVYVKMARGEMVRFLAEAQVDDIDAVREFTGMGYQFDASRSNATTYVFVR